MLPKTQSQTDAFPGALTYRAALRLKLPAYVIACAVCWLWAGSVEVRAASVVAERIDGATVTGEWLGSRDGRGIRIHTANGPEDLPLNALVKLTFGGVKDTPFGELFYLADGGRLHGELVRGADEAIVVRTLLGSAMTIPFSRLAAVRLGKEGQVGRADELFDTALNARLPGQDVLIACGADSAEVKTLRGRLDRLDADSGSFVFDGRARHLRTERVFGVVFASGAAKPPVFPVRIHLNDGSVVAGRIQTADANRLHLETSLGSDVDLPLTRVVRIDIRSDRVVYVSDLQPVDEKVEGILHRPWPVRRDHSVTAGTLSIDGRVFDKGIGCHSRTELTYDLGGAYETFAVTIGIDDSVRPRGSVVFRVLGDGGVLFESNVLTGRDTPQDVIVDVTGVARLTLVTDYGDGLDLSDHADWGAARLLKPATNSPNREVQ